MKYLLILLPLTSFGAEECLKSIKIQEVFYRSNPNIFVKVQADEVVKIGETKKIQIQCDLYQKIKVGDLLADENTDVSRIRLFSKDRGVLERKRYKVLAK